MYQERCAEVESLTASLGLSRKEAEKHAGEVKRLAGENATLGQARNPKPWQPLAPGVRVFDSREEDKLHAEIERLKASLIGRDRELKATNDCLMTERQQKLDALEQVKKKHADEKALAETIEQAAKILRKINGLGPSDSDVERALAILDPPEEEDTDEKALRDLKALDACKACKRTSGAVEQAVKTLRSVHLPLASREGMSDVIEAAVEILDPELDECAVVCPMCRGPGGASGSRFCSCSCHFVEDLAAMRPSATAIQSSVSATPTVSLSALNEGPRCPPPCNKLLDAQEISDGRTSCTKCSPVMLKPSKQAEERRPGRASP